MGYTSSSSGRMMSSKKLGGVAVDKSKPTSRVAFFGFLVFSGSIASLEARFLFTFAEVLSERTLWSLVTEFGMTDLSISNNGRGMSGKLTVVLILVNLMINRIIKRGTVNTVNYKTFTQCRSVICLKIVDFSEITRYNYFSRQGTCFNNIYIHWTFSW